MTNLAHLENNVISITPYLNKKKKTNNAKTSRNFTAEPIKDIELINEIKDYLKSTGKYGYRNWMIFILGINCGRRCGDILKLKITDVYDISSHTIKNEIIHIEEKTGKQIKFYFPNILKSELLNYIETLDFVQDTDYLFPSQKLNCNGTYKMNTKSYNNILNKVKKELKLNFRFSTHSMRKTFGYNKYLYLKASNSEIDPLLLLQECFGHKDSSVTLRYIGVTDEIKYNLYNNAIL